jgi:hypothetical protein
MVAPSSSKASSPPALRPYRPVGHVGVAGAPSSRENLSQGYDSIVRPGATRSVPTRPMTNRWGPASEPDASAADRAGAGGADSADASAAAPGGGRRGAGYLVTVPLRRLVMAVFAVFDVWVLVIGLVMSLGAALADFVLSPRHWRERPSYLRLPRPWEIPPAAPALLRGHWRRIVLGAPRARRRLHGHRRPVLSRRAARPDGASGTLPAAQVVATLVWAGRLVREHGEGEGRAERLQLRAALDAATRYPRSPASPRLG